MSDRTVFFVSDHSGVTAETLGHSLISQFDTLEFRKTTVPFVSTLDKARQLVQLIDRTAEAEGQPPIVFSTLVQDDVRDTVRGANALFLDFFDSFLAPLEAALGRPSAHATGVSHSIKDTREYDRRMDATNFALAHDDGMDPRGYPKADVILVGISRTGKTPTCLYLALQYGVFAANFPLTEEDLDRRDLPDSLGPHRDKLFGLTIEPARLVEIRRERRIGRRYASLQQVSFEIRQAENLYRRRQIPYLDTTRCSIEELASRILDQTGLERRSLP